MPLLGFGSTMQLDQCYDEACVEAFFKAPANSDIKIEMLGDNSSGVSSAGADADSSEGHEISSLSSSSSEDETSEDIEEEIAFLQKKQRLLHRALAAMKEEAAYNVFNARVYAAGKMTGGSSIWLEAKEIISLLKEQEGNQIETVRTQIRPQRSLIDRSAINAKRKRIDISSVRCVTAGNFLQQPESDSRSKCRVVSTVSLTGQWMVQALSHSMPFLLNQHDSRSDTWGELEVMDDPNVGLIVMSPPKIPFPNTVSMKSALSFTSLPQLITTPTPPFSILHANKAFLVFTRLSSKQVISKPVEAILKMVPTNAGQGPSWSSELSHLLNSLVIPSNKPCKLSVTPITDTSRCASMSHLLVKVAPSEKNASDSTSPRICEDSRSNSSTPLKGGRVDEIHPVYGAVG